MRSLARLTAVGVVMAAAAAASAETIHMKNGNVHEGKIVSITDKQVILETAELGRIPISMKEIERIDQAGPARTDGSETTADSGDAADAALLAALAKIPEAGTAGGEGAGGAETDGGVDTAAGRLKKRWSHRTVRSTSPVASGKEGATRGPRLRPRRKTRKKAKATIGGEDLARVPKGAEIIVFEPPRRFAAAAELIEIGRRTIAKMEMAGVGSVWLKVAAPEGEKQLPMKLSDVKRHLRVHTPSSRTRLLEGVSPGDWLRLELANGLVVQGRLAGFAAGTIQLTVPIRDELTGELGRREAEVKDVVRMDGFLRSAGVLSSLEQVRPGEPLALVMWPDGDLILGRFLEMEHGVIALDENGNGEADHRIHKTGPIAAVRRMPMLYRRMATELSSGDYVRVGTSTQFDDARVDHVHRGKILGMTAFAVSLETEGGAVVIPFRRAEGFAQLDHRGRIEVDRGRNVDPSELRSDVELFPGAPAEGAAELDAASGISALTDGRKVTHVFVSAPFRGLVFGVQLGAPASEAVTDPRLNFDTVVTPNVDENGVQPPVEMISDSLKGLRFTLLLGRSGQVSAVEMTARN